MGDAADTYSGPPRGPEERRKALDPQEACKIGNEWQSNAWDAGEEKGDRVNEEWRVGVNKGRVYRLREQVAPSRRTQ